MPGERKSVEPMAAIVARARVSAKHQSLLIWSARRPGRRGRFAKDSRGGFAWHRTTRADRKPGSSMTPVFTKKGTHSVGVARQYCGRLGKQEQLSSRGLRCRSPIIRQSLPIAYQLYLPETRGK